MSIHIAALNGHLAALELLVKTPGCDVNQALSDGRTPAYIAAQMGQTAALEVLGKAGCDMNQADKNGATPAHIAAQKGHTAALELLVKAGCDVNQADKYGATPAFIAAQQGQTAALELLVKAGCDMNQAASDGRTPAHVAAQNGLSTALAAAINTLEKSDIKNEKSRKKNKKKSKKKKKAAIESAVEEEEVTPLLRSEQLETISEIAPALAPPPVVPRDDETADGTEAYPMDSSDEEVDLCRCAHCLELEREQGETA